MRLRFFIFIFLFYLLFFLPFLLYGSTKDAPREATINYRLISHNYWGAAGAALSKWRACTDSGNAEAFARVLVRGLSTQVFEGDLIEANYTCTFRPIPVQTCADGMWNSGPGSMILFRRFRPVSYILGAARTNLEPLFRLNEIFRLVEQSHRRVSSFFLAAFVVCFTVLFVSVAFRINDNRTIIRQIIFSEKIVPSIIHVDIELRRRISHCRIIDINW